MKRERCGRVLGLAVLAWLGVAGVGAAAESAGTNTNTTVITAAYLTYDFKRSIADFQGEVVVVDPQLRLESDSLTVVLSGTNSIKVITATGNVRIWQQDKYGTCHKAVYQAATGEVILTGEARITRGTDSVAGKRITFQLNEDRMTCEGGGKVIFQPKEGAAVPTR